MVTISTLQTRNTIAKSVAPSTIICYRDLHLATEIVSLSEVTCGPKKVAVFKYQRTLVHPPLVFHLRFQTSTFCLSLQSSGSWSTLLQSSTSSFSPPLLVFHFQSSLLQSSIYTFSPPVFDPPSFRPPLLALRFLVHLPLVLHLHFQSSTFSPPSNSFSPSPKHYIRPLSR